MWRTVPNAATSMWPTTPARTGTAQSVRDRRRGIGWKRARKTCCPWSISTSSSPCRPRSPDRLLEQEGGLRTALQGIGGNGHDDRRRPQAPWRPYRYDQCASHFGIGAGDGTGVRQPPTRILGPQLSFKPGAAYGRSQPEAPLQFGWLCLPGLFIIPVHFYMKASQKLLRKPGLVKVVSLAFPRL